MKRIISIIIFAVMITVATMAQGLTPWDGTVPASFTATGAGTEASPYLITEASQLAYIAKQIDGTNGKLYVGVYFRLEKDLDLGGNLARPSNWLPIGSKGARNFHGIFDGNNKSIHHIYINDPTRTPAGFFGQNSTTAVVKNLTIASGSVTAKQYVGAVAGTNQGVIDNCVSLIDVTATTSYAGGIAGSNYGHIKNSYNTGKVTTSSWSGGISGIFNKSSSYIGTIENCFNTGDIYCSSASTKSGGIVGEMLGTAILVNCYNSGNIFYTFSGTNTGKIGGLIGSASGGTISCCYNTGHIESASLASIGGLIGSKTQSASSAAITDCYYDKQMCAVLSAIGTLEDTENVKGLLTKEMVRVAGLPAFSTDRWLFTDNMYPRLQVFATNKIANLYTVPIVLASTNEIKYETRYAVKSNFTVSTALPSIWTVAQGTSVALNQSAATVTRPESGDDNVVLKVIANGISRDLKIVVYQKPVTVTIVQPTIGGTIKMMDGETELISPAAVESNTTLTLIAMPGDEYMLDVFTVNSNDIDGDKVTITGNTTLSANFSLIAPPDPWDGTIATEFGGGSGKEIAPYLIKSAGQLAYLSQQVNGGNNYKDTYFKLIYNLDMGGDKNNWTPIGHLVNDERKTVFMGHFDGNGKEIRNLYMSHADIEDVALFGYVDGGSIRNLGIDANSCITSTMVNGRTAAIVAYKGGGELSHCYNKGNVSGVGGVVGGVAGQVGVGLSNCYNEGNITANEGSAGGIAGAILVAKITECRNSGKITGKSIGGIVGFSNSSSISQCYNTGEVRTNVTDGNVGGIVGSTGGSIAQNKVDECVNFGTISTEFTVVGGISGRMSSGSIVNCYNVGHISGKSYVGGIAGHFNSAVGSISDSYSIGEITGTPNDVFTGGLVGRFEAGGLSNCYYDKQLVSIAKATGNQLDAEKFKGVLTSVLTGSAIGGYDVRYWTFTEGLYPQLTKFKDLEYSILNASAATLHAVNETNFETVKAVRTNFTVSTANAIVWTVEAGTTVAITGTAATVTPKVDAEEQITLKATLGGLSRSIGMIVPKLAYKLTINPSANGFVAVKNAAGEVLPSGSELAPQAVITLVPTADEGYRFAKWWDDNTENPRTITVNNSFTVSAIFEINSYTLTATAGANGEITPEGVTTVKFGANQTYTIMPDLGYTTETLLVDGNSVAIASNYTFNHIAANHTISATFKIKSYTITATVGDNGTITPNGATTVEHGTNQTYTITADAGYQIAKLTVDGATVPIANTYTFNSVVANHTIDVTFEKQVFVITASSGEFGSISPSGNVEVVVGKDQEFFLIPNDGYVIKDVLVDGVTVLKDVVNSKYTFKSVKADHTIHVVFDDGSGIQTLEDNQISIWSNKNTICLNSTYNKELRVEIVDITSGEGIIQTLFTVQTQIAINGNVLCIVRVFDGDVIKTIKKIAIN